MKLGAREVIGVDNDLSPAAVEFLIPYFKSPVRMHEMNLYDLTPETFGKFDVVVCSGVLYHLRYPMQAIKALRDLLPTGGHLVLETAIFAGENEHALLYCPIGAESPYEPSSCTFFNLKGLADSLFSLGLLPKRARCKNNTPPSATFAPNKAIDRTVFTCQYVPETIDRIVDRYWHATHKTHLKEADFYEGGEWPTKPSELVKLAIEDAVRASEANRPARPTMQGLEEALRRSEEGLRQAEAVCAERLDVIHRLDEALRRSEAESAERLDVIGRLDEALRQSEAECAAQRGSIEALTRAARDPVRASARLVKWLASRSSRPKQGAA